MQLNQKKFGHSTNSVSISSTSPLDSALVLVVSKGMKPVVMALMERKVTNLNLKAFQLK